MARDMRGGGLVRGKKGDRNPIKVRPDQAILPAKTVAAIKAAHGTEGLRAMVGMKKPVASGGKVVKAARGEAVMSAAKADMADRSIPGGIRGLIHRTAGRVPQTQLKAGGRYQTGYLPEDEEIQTRRPVTVFGMDTGLKYKNAMPAADRVSEPSTVEMPRSPEDIDPHGLSASAYRAPETQAPSSRPSQVYRRPDVTGITEGVPSTGESGFMAGRAAEYHYSKPYDVERGRYLTTDEDTRDVGVLRENLPGRANTSQFAEMNTIVGNKGGRGVRYTLQSAEGGAAPDQNYRDAIARNAADRAELARIESMKPGGAGYLREQAQLQIANTLANRGRGAGRYGGIGSSRRLSEAQNAAAGFAGIDERAASTAATNRVAMARLGFDMDKEGFDRGEKNRRFDLDVNKEGFNQWKGSADIGVKLREMGRADEATAYERNNKWLDSISGLDAAKASLVPGAAAGAQERRDRMQYVMSQSFGRFGLGLQHIDPQTRSELEHLLPRVVENDKEATSIFNNIVAALGMRQANQRTDDVGDVRIAGRERALYGSDNYTLRGGGRLSQQQVAGGGILERPNQSRLRQAEREQYMPQYLRSPDSGVMTFEEFVQKQKRNQP